MSDDIRTQEGRFQSPLTNAAMSSPDPIFAKIEELHNKIIPYIKEANVTEHYQTVILKVDETTTKEDLQEDFDFLKKFEATLLHEYLRIFNWNTPEQWKAKIAASITDLYEVRLLKKNQTAMRKAWVIYARSKYAKYKERAKQKRLQSKPEEYSDETFS